MKANDDEDAVRIVNASDFGLGGSVFSANSARADAIAARLRTGMCNINDFGINYLCQGLPFGGCKISGFDRFAGVEGLRGNCLLRSETRDRIPGVKTVVPPPLQYPLGSNSFDFSVALVKLMYGNITQMISGMRELATFKKKA